MSHSVGVSSTSSSHSNSSSTPLHSISSSSALPNGKTNGHVSSSTAGQQTTGSRTVDTRIKKIRPLLPPACLLEEIETPAYIQEFIAASRQHVANALHGRDDRLIVVVGPCSIHDVKAAIEYAHKLKQQADALKDDLIICMRVYFEKPRTRVGWKGLINDPYLDGSYAINAGLRLARKLLLDLNLLGLPVAAEMLDTISPQFIADLITWGAIGARTTESQLHRELVSGLSMPIGFKNGTSGTAKIAVDAIVAAASPHSFLSVTTQGLAAIVETMGNEDCHLILRGGDDGPNYSRAHVSQHEKSLLAAKVPVAIMIDCSHGNSNKNHNNQPLVVKSIVEQLSGEVDEKEKADNNGLIIGQSIVGCMIESNLVAGNQSFSPGDPINKLVYGKSITDACVDFETTITCLQQLAAGVRARRARVKAHKAKQ